MSSPDSSDAEDDLNVMSVQKNATRVAELMHSMIPSLDPNMTPNAPLPKGMNTSDLIRSQMSKTVSSIRPVFGSQTSSRHPPPTEEEVASEEEEEEEVVAKGEEEEVGKGEGPVPR